jgi:hypothetical protein
MLKRLKWRGEGRKRVKGEGEKGEGLIYVKLK